MAWIENETWEVEQGVSALKRFELVDANDEPWTFVGWDVNATISDSKGRAVHQVVVMATPLLGVVDLILPEAIVNSLKIDGDYRYDCLMVPPGSNVIDGEFLATGPLTVALRSTRRDP